LHGIGRLKPGVTLAQARADLDRVMRNLAAAYPVANQGNGATVVPLDEQLVGGVRLPLLLLLGAVGFVLLIACANTANLLLGRAIARQKDFAIRRALGAGRTAIVRQVIVESLLVALAAGIAGLLVATWTLDWVTNAKTANTSGFWAAYVRTFQYFDVRLDPRVLVFNFATAIGVGILFGIAPAWQAWRSRAACSSDVLPAATDLTASRTRVDGGRAAGARSRRCWH
jgi:predicted lysophospholipase L1 biosynthesis ABC-type transport system permease subunit